MTYLFSLNFSAFSLTMQWAKPDLSHHCTETTMSVLSLCNFGVESPHLLAIGGNLGTIDVIDLKNRSSLASFVEMHQSNVLGVEFHHKDHLISYDNFDFLHIDLETSNRSQIFGTEKSVNGFTFSSANSPIIAFSNENLYLCDLRSAPTELMENPRGEITELCLLPDDFTLTAIQAKSLVITDLRRPDKFYSLNLPQSFEKLTCNSHYLAAISSDPVLYSFELPLCPAIPKQLLVFDSGYIIKPSFFGDLILTPDASGAIYAIEPETVEIDVLTVDQQGPIVSITSNSSEIAISYEDDIYVFSSFPFEDNLIRPRIDDEDDLFFPSDFVEEEEEQSDWTTQNNEIVIESGECTYEKYGYFDQQIFVCYTCMAKENGRLFGICEQCAKICHDGHDVHAIGSRRRFRCDCGNDRAHGNCRNMFEPKTTENPRNHYNHNFNEKWCYCDKPDDRTEPMVQCICCDDWYHHTCIGMYSENRCILLEMFPQLDDWVFVCNNCSDTRLKFLNGFRDGEIPSEIREYVYEMQRDFGIDPNDGDENKEGVGFRLLGGRWISKEQFSSFAGKYEEYDKEFGDFDTTEEDLALPKTKKQEAFAKIFKDLYTNMFRNVSGNNRTIIQRSDVQEAISQSVSRFMRQQRDPDEE
ncbi:putative E3 ubiquitin-protein ligase UBR7 isoform X1 [Histomonas meleagridis]|uniref:putative E3 ubiquitin-protein ligase UBR7 isoform X1 n=1 Tax=Histomonas meleagridis TaxID=135588 RepID=UPI0035594972|nr:putative E3 ubiquitin-protein ligase UBR7 isoform X1 [Histomonas meleagridis]KAH0803472.1 putative E3 ubiquitin-protein ligase UBR7 isoform X1 [Histomonas meleagridis]